MYILDVEFRLTDTADTPSLGVGSCWLALRERECFVDTVLASPLCTEMTSVELDFL